MNPWQPAERGLRPEKRALKMFQGRSLTGNKTDFLSDRQGAQRA